MLRRRESRRDSTLAVEVLLESYRRQSFPYVDARGTLSRLPGDNTGIVGFCLKPSGPKTEIQHD